MYVCVRACVRVCKCTHARTTYYIDVTNAMTELKLQYLRLFYVRQSLLEVTKTVDLFYLVSRPGE